MSNYLFFLLEEDQLMSEKTKKISLIGLILMIFTSTFGFANTTVAYDQMGYGSIIWYVVAALLFFLPSSLMFAEYGAAFKDAKGGIYSWLKESVGEKIAFIGTFIWLSAWIVWMVSTASKVWIPLSSLLFGADKTQTWGVFGLTSTEVIGLLGIAWIILVTVFASHGMNKIAEVANIGGTFVMVLSGLFIVLSIVVWIGNKGAIAEPIHTSSFITSPNPSFQSPIAIISFVVYAIFAYGGLESMSGVIDSIDKPEKTFPMGCVISMILITVLYSLMILMWGISTNWHSVLGGHEVNLGNISYILMNNLGIQMGNALGTSHRTALLIGNVLTRFTGLSMFLAYCGSFFVVIYSPVKSFIMGSNPELWPERLTKINEHGIPANAMQVQAIVVCIIIFLVAFGGNAAQKFYQILTNMANVTTSAPYLFLVGAFPAFKKRQDIERPFEIYKSHFWTNLIVIVVWLVLALGIIFTCLQPILEHDYQTAFWTIFGPVFFGGVAWIFYDVDVSRHKHKAEK